MATTSSIQLKPKKHKVAIKELLQFLRDHRGNDIEIDVQEIDTFSGNQIELILCGYHQWKSEDLSFSIVSADSTLVSRMTTVGVPPELFTEGS